MTRFKYKSQVMDIRLPDGQKTHNLKQMYEFFCKRYPEEDIPFPLFAEVIKRYNTLILEQLFEGKRVILGSGLGHLGIIKKERSFNHRRIDWYETNKLKKEGINKHVYYTDNLWVRFSWYKPGRLTNQTVYKFTPTKGCNGNTKKLAELIRDNPFALDSFAYKNEINER